MTTLTFRSPVTRELRPYRGANVPRPADAGDAFYVTSPFGPRSDGFHGGVDIGNGRIGYDLVSPASGRVIAAGNLGRPWSEPTTRFASGNYGGLMVVIEHAPGVASIIAHMRMRTVSAGAVVLAGQKVGEIGDSGSAVGQAHTHFGIQAPAEMVPAGTRTQGTTYGFGLDVDPWPILLGAVIEDSDVNLPSGLKHVTQGIVGVRNRLRKDPDTATGSRVLTDAEGAQFVQVYGLGVTGEAWNLGGKAGNTYAWVGWAGETWFVAEPLVTNLQLTATGKAVIPSVEVIKEVPGDCSAQDARLGKVAEAVVALRGANKSESVAIEALARAVTG